MQEGETIEDAAHRELLEEAGIEAPLEKVGILTFEFPDTQTTHEGHIFRAHDFSGEITEGEEMRPAWFHIDEIPFDSMWETDRHWLPVFLKGKIGKELGSSSLFISSSSSGVKRGIKSVSVSNSCSDKLSKEIILWLDICFY